MPTKTASPSSSSVAQRGAGSLSLWILGVAVSLLSVTAFVMLAGGVLLGLTVSLGLPMIIVDVLAVPLIAAAVWIAVWMCCRVVAVEKRISRGGNIPPAAAHTLKPWITTGE